MLNVISSSVYIYIHALCVCSAPCGLQPCRQRLVHSKWKKTQNIMQISCGSSEKWPPLGGDFKYAKVLELQLHTAAQEKAA